MNGPAPLEYGWWLASRASGIVALLCVTVSVAIGLMMAGKVSRRPGMAKALMGIHEQTALAGLLAIAVHGITLLGDPWLNPGPAGVVVPFAMEYRPVFTGLGIIAGWLAVLLGLSFYFRKRIGAKRWRSLHRATLLVWVLGVAHTIGAGTDGQSTWMLAFVGVSTAVIVPLLVLRMRGPRPVRRPAAPRPGSPPATQRVS
ncbi:ferric reductase-like transmembrane domain-containing protein [Svornostia abyssi]|uniref:Ferric reductase-like transmembrane domain-containing protein n=1 Tax=Svornostia abyssi TaxID=2898438 RepID=A0ABY5PMG5_9ACTN|nr:ferric reductase-like transmembrane domain-containing protein [Parviterribacteraceae bacterium J379]